MGCCCRGWKVVGGCCCRSRGILVGCGWALLVGVFVVGGFRGHRLRVLVVGRVCRWWGVGDGRSPPFALPGCVLAFAVGRGWWVLVLALALVRVAWLHAPVRRWGWVLAPARVASLGARVRCLRGMVVGACARVVLTIFMINLKQMPAQSYLNFQVCYEMKNLWQLE